MGGGSWNGGMALAPTSVTWVCSQDPPSYEGFPPSTKTNTSKFPLSRSHIRLLYKEPLALLCYVVKLIILTIHILHGL